jgi:hypothetical protein
MMEAERISATSVNFFDVTQRNISKTFIDKAIQQVTARRDFAC